MAVSCSIMAISHMGCYRMAAPKMAVLLNAVTKVALSKYLIKAVPKVALSKILKIIVFLKMNSSCTTY